MAEHALFLDGREVHFELGETLLQVASRAGAKIPTLCDDPRLEPAGACRTCLVEVEGESRLVPSCVTRAAPGMVVASASARVERHRRTLFALYLTDHPEPAQGDTLLQLARRYDAPRDWGRLPSLRAPQLPLRSPSADLPCARRKPHAPWHSPVPRHWPGHTRMNTTEAVISRNMRRRWRRAVPRSPSTR